MTWGAVAVGGATVIGGAISGQQQAQAQAEANEANAAMAAAQLGEQARQFDIGQRVRGLDIERTQQGELERRQYENELNRQLQDRFGALRGENLAALAPYRQAGEAATGQMTALLGLGTPEEQAAARSAFSESPGQSFLRQEQEQALLRNAAAIGGLGGGNVRTALQGQAFGRAQTDYQNYLRQLQALGGQGLSAARGGLEAGYGPERFRTQRGVALDVANMPSDLLKHQGFNYEPSGSGGSDLWDFLSTPGPLGRTLGF